jgi:Tfp pilus assembly protein PilX
MPKLSRFITKTLAGNQRGIVLVSVAMVAFVAVAFVSVAAIRTVHDKTSTDIRVDHAEAFYAAQAGENAMKAAIMRDALQRFQQAQAAWAASGMPTEAILTDAQAQAFFSPNVTLPGVQLPNGTCFDTVQATLAWSGTQVEPLRQDYTFTYTINALGVNPQSDQVCQISSGGNFTIAAQRQSFANYALFTDNHTLTSGTKVWFTTNTNFTGRVHTNGRFAFAYFPTFSNGLVSSSGNTAPAGDEDTAFYYNNGSPVTRDADNNAPRDIPVFGEGFDREADEIPLPENAVDQRAASVGGTAADNAELRSRLGLPADSTPPPDGIYVPNDGASLTGGIYVQGTVSNILLSVDGNDRQNYNITHTDGTSSSIVVDAVSNQTTVDGITYVGTPNGAFYVAGDVNSLGGPARSSGVAPPAVQSETALSVFAEGDVTITRDIVYESNPLDDADAQNVFGIFTPGGDILIGASAPDDIVIHSTLMTSDDNGVVQVVDYDEGDPRGVATILGGVISSYYGAFGTFNSDGHQSGYARNFLYDLRLNGGMAPPFFPTTQLFDPATLDGGLNQTMWAAQKNNIPGFSEQFEIPSSDPDFDPDFS